MCGAYRKCVSNEIGNLSKSVTLAVKWGNTKKMRQVPSCTHIRVHRIYRPDRRYLLPISFFLSVFCSNEFRFFATRFSGCETKYEEYRCCVFVISYIYLIDWLANRAPELFNSLLTNYILSILFFDLILILFQFV